MKKLFSLVKNPSVDCCNAMRCQTKEPLSSVTDIWNYSNQEIWLCDRHLKEYQKHLPHTVKQTNPIGYNSETCEVVKSTQLAMDYAKADLVQVSNSSIDRAFQDLPITVHTEQAKVAKQAATDLEIINQESLEFANDLVASVHKEEKLFKAGVDAVKKPLNALKKYIQEQIKQPETDYKEAKKLVNSKISVFMREAQQVAQQAMNEGKHEEVQTLDIETPSNVCMRTKREYAIKNDGKNLPVEFLLPDETKAEGIVRIIPRELCRPNYDLINDLVQKHGKTIEIPDVEVIEYEEAQMKPGRREVGY
jgi:hypothetical protein